MNFVLWTMMQTYRPEIFLHVGQIKKDAERKSKSPQLCDGCKNNTPVHCFISFPAMISVLSASASVTLNANSTSDLSDYRLLFLNCIENCKIGT